MKRFGLLVGLVSALVCAGTGIAAGDLTVSLTPEQIVKDLKDACLLPGMTGAGRLAAEEASPVDCRTLPQGPSSSSSADGTAGCVIRHPDIDATWRGVDRWMSGSPIVGGETFFGSLGKGVSWSIGSSLNYNQYVPVEIRFSPDTTTLCQVFRVEQSFAPVGVGTFPGSVWDVSDTLNPRRLNVCFAEWDDGTGPNDPPNLIWDPDSTTGPPAFGKWEFLYVMLSSYDGTGTTYAGRNILIEDLDVLYAWYPRVEPGHTLGEAYPAAIDIAVFDQYVTDETVSPDSAQLSLAWTYCGDGTHSGFRVLFGTTSDPTTEVAILGPDMRKYLDTGLTNGVTYYYKIEILGPLNEVIGFGTVFSGRPQQVSSNVNLVGRWNGDWDYGDIWGYTDPGTNREYALICARSSGLYIIDIDQTPPQQAAFVATWGSDAKDVKVYSHYAILVNEGGSIMIIDITNISSPNVIRTITPDGNGSHNCLVDGDYLYVVGNYGAGGVEIFDLSVLPAQPPLISQFGWTYYHDLDIHNDTIYAAAIYGGGVDVIDATNKFNLQYITNFNYPGSGAHNCEVTADGDYVFVGDEIGSSGNYTRVFDVSNLGSITKVYNMEIVPGAIVHNCYILGDLLYVAHYALGLRVWNILDPAAPYEVGFYDTRPESEYGMNGAWSVYPYFASGRVIVSDMQSGLYVLDFTGDVPTCDCSCHADPVCDGVMDVLDVVAAIDNIFRGKPAITDPACPHKSRVDINCDCSEDVLDVIGFVNNAFRSYPFPPVCDPCTESCP